MLIRLTSDNICLQDVQGFGIGHASGSCQNDYSGHPVSGVVQWMNRLVCEAIGFENQSI